MTEGSKKETKRPFSEEFDKSLFKWYENAMREYDKAIFYVASGALALTFTFIEKFVDVSNIQHKWLMLTGWCLLVAVIIMHVISHYISAGEIKAVIEVSIENENRATPENKKTDIPAKSIYGTLRRFRIHSLWKRILIVGRVKVLNMLCISSLFLGLIFIVIFVNYNFGMTKAKNPNPKGTPPEIKTPRDKEPVGTGFELPKRVVKQNKSED